jgi:UPF0716 protein FxsA
VALIAVVVLLAVPFLELWLAVEVAGAVRVLPTLLALVALSALGIVVVRREGVVVWRRITAEMTAGRAPARELLDGGLLLLGGTLLALPGFVSAVIGLLLLFPPVRAALRPVLVRGVRRRLTRRGAAAAVFVDTIASSAGGARATRTPWGTVIGGGPVDLGDDGVVVDVDGRPADGPRAEVVEVEVDRPEELPPGRP